MYYDFATDKKISPYLSLGAGFARHNAELNSLAGISVTEIDESDTVFAFQIGAGASYDISEKTALFAGYRYLGSADPDFDTLEAEYDAHELRVGLRYTF